MAVDRRKPRIDAEAGVASPLGVAIAEGDRETLAMVRAAIDTRRLCLAFQPVVLARDPSRIAFHEGFIRVMEPNGRVIPARDFMAAVETQEMGREIDCAVLEMGLSVLSRHADLRLSINLSARSIGYPRWGRILKQGIKQWPNVGERLILEISETSAMQVPEVVSAFMDEMQVHGIAFALDDFGSGNTAIRHFRDFCFDMLKIDSQFVRNIDKDSDNRALAAALLSIARHFDMFTVAESVETEGEALCLQALGVDCLQGNAFGAPTVNPNWNGARSQKSA